MRLLLALLLLLCAIGAAVQQSPPPAPSKAVQKPQKIGGTKQQATNSDQGPAKTLSSVSKDNDVPSEQQAQNGSSDKSQKPPTDWITWFTGVLAGVAILQLIVIGTQIHYMHGGLALSRDTAIRQLRAYVCIATGIVKFRMPNLPEAQIHIKNYGQTPAYDVQMWISTWIEEFPLKVTLPTPQKGFNMSAAILAPNEAPHVLIAEHDPVLAESVPLLGTPKGTIYIYGEIQYRDAFGVQRHTKYRYIYGGSQGTPRTMLDHGVPCGLIKPDMKGNEAD